MPASVSRLRGALLLMVLVSCRTRDNPNVCSTADECGDGRKCNLTTQRCEEINVGRTDGSSDGSAGPDGPAAEVSADAPGSCQTAANCTADQPICLPAGRCVDCMGHGDCTADPLRPVCVDNACVACAQAPATACEQKNPATPRCAGTTCAECVTSRDCSLPAAPICVDNKCVRCTADSQCQERDGDNPGLCLAHLDGRCATDPEVIYVNRRTGCINSTTGPGTSDMPFCQPAPALESVGPGRRVLLLRGEGAFSALEVPKDFLEIANGTISVIGQPGAAIVPGASVGVNVLGGDVFLRDLTIRDGEEEGVVADGPANARLYRCVIRLNKKGGLRFSNGAGFVVTNTILDGNGPGFINNNTTPFGGALLGEPEAGRPSVFRFNTVIRNEMVGVVCGKAGQELSSVLLWDNDTEQRGCQVDMFSQEGGGDPRLDPTRPYWLTAGSPCRDRGDPTSYPPDDWKGEPRPGGARSDCGADEFHE